MSRTRDGNRLTLSCRYGMMEPGAGSRPTQLWSIDMLLRYVGDKKLTGLRIGELGRCVDKFNDAFWRRFNADTMRLDWVDSMEDHDGSFYLVVCFKEGTPFRSIGTTRGVPRRPFRQRDSIDMAKAFPEGDWKEIDDE